MANLLQVERDDRRLSRLSDVCYCGRKIANPEGSDVCPPGIPLEPCDEGTPAAPEQVSWGAITG